MPTNTAQSDPRRRSKPPTYRFATRKTGLAGEDGRPWDKTAWQMWRADRWAPACRAAGVDPVPRPYDLRHSYASLLLAEGCQPLYVARQLGRSVAVLLSTYAHLIDEYEDAQHIDADREITAARRHECGAGVGHAAG